MTEEDEEFQRLEREAKMRRMSEEDDDIQDYKKPWKKLTKEERASFDAANPKTQEEWDALFDGIEARLKEKNT